jgi:hypothetical protein
MVLARDMSYQSGILVLVSSADWGAGGIVLLSLCGSLIRSGLDCGCIVCGSARSSCIRLFDAVHHQGLRLSFGEFGVSLVESLYVEASEPSLEDRRVRRGVQQNWGLILQVLHATVFLVLYMRMFAISSPMQFNLLDSEWNHTLRVLI